MFNFAAEFPKINKLKRKKHFQLYKSEKIEKGEKHENVYILLSQQYLPRGNVHILISQQYLPKGWLLLLNAILR